MHLSVCVCVWVSSHFYSLWKTDEPLCILLHVKVCSSAEQTGSEQKSRTEDNAHVCLKNRRGSEAF